jgi:hypothetical protein
MRLNYFNKKKKVREKAIIEGIVIFTSWFGLQALCFVPYFANLVSFLGSVCFGVKYYRKMFSTKNIFRKELHYCKLTLSFCSVKLFHIYGSTCCVKDWDQWGNVFFDRKCYYTS